MSEIVKVAFVGAPGTGKTTLFEVLRNELAEDSGVVFLEEVARQFFNTNDIPKAERETSAVQGRIQRVILECERIAVVSTKNPHTIISDRSVIDPAVYTLVGGNRPGSDYLLDNVRDWLPTYTRMYLLDPTGVPIVNDGIRYEDPEHRARIHETYIEFLAMHDIDYELLSGSVNERAETVKAVL